MPASFIDEQDPFATKAAEGFTRVLFGRAISGVQTDPTDIWERADSSETQRIWLAPTAPRIHNIKSTSVNDTEFGIGCQKVRVVGLETWDSIETFEDVTTDGITDAPTQNSYVMINVMFALEYGVNDVNGENVANLGAISATAEVDNTVTAQINAEVGVTESAIYGVPSVQNLFIWKHFASLLEVLSNPATSNKVNVQLLANFQPDVNPAVFIHTITKGLNNTATSHYSDEIKPPQVLMGPAILKVQAIALVADTDMSAGFSITIEPKPDEEQPMERVL